MTLREIRAQVKGWRAAPEDKLGEELIELRREQFNLRMQGVTGQGAKPDQHGKVRKSIARLKTILRERTAQAEDTAK